MRTTFDTLAAQAHIEKFNRVAAEYFGDVTPHKPTREQKDRDSNVKDMRLRGELFPHHGSPLHYDGLDFYPISSPVWGSLASQKRRINNE